MPLNSYFQQGYTNEQDLVDDLMKESIEIYGQEVYYLPREVEVRNSIFLEPLHTVYNHAVPIEMYVETVTGMAGAQDLFTKFGIDIRDQFEFRVMRSRFNESIASLNVVQNPTVPKEGDIIFFPLMATYFVIRYVEDEDAFYQLNKVYSWLLKTENFEFSSEVFSTGNPDIDKLEWNKAPSVILDCRIVNTSFLDGNSPPIDEEMIRDEFMSLRGSLFSQEISNATTFDLMLSAKLYDVVSVIKNSTLVDTWDIRLKFGYLHFNKNIEETEENESLKYDAKMFFPSSTRFLVCNTNTDIELRILKMVNFENLMPTDEVDDEEVANEFEDLDEILKDSQAQNDILEKEAEKVVDFSIQNPFGNF